MDINYGNLFHNLLVLLYRFGIILVFGTVVFILVALIVISIVKALTKKESILSLSNDKKSQIVALALACIPAFTGGIFSINPGEALFRPIYTDTVVSENDSISKNEDQTNSLVDSMQQATIIPNANLDITSENFTIDDYSNLEIVIAIDKSTSMCDSDGTQIALDTACAFVDLCKNAGSCTVSVITFGGEQDKEIVINKANASMLSNEIKEKIKKIEYDSKFTNIKCALNASNDVLNKDNSKKMILLLSDGKIGGYTNEKNMKIREEIIQNLDDNLYCVPVYTVSLKNSLQDESEYDQELMEQIAIKTGASNEIIDTSMGLNNLANDNNLYEFFIKILQKYLGSKLLLSNKTITVDLNNSYQIESEIKSNSQNASLLIYGECSNIEVQSDTDEIYKGNNYIVININNPNKAVHKYTVSSNKEAKFRYAFIYNFDISTGYYMKDILTVGEPFSMQGILISDEEINKDDVNAYLQVFTKEDRFKKNEPTPTNTITLFRNNNNYTLGSEYVFASPGEYYCRLVIEDKNGDYSRTSDYNLITVVEPQIKILSARSQETDAFNIVVDLILHDNENIDYTKNEILDNFEVSLSIDKKHFQRATKEGQIFKANLFMDKLSKSYDLFVKTKIKNNINLLCDTEITTIEKTLKDNVLENAAPYLINGEIKEETFNFMFLSNNTYEINLNNFFNDDSSEFDIVYEIESQGTKCEIAENDNGNIVMKITSNIFGLNRVRVRAVDIENPLLISDPLTIAFNINFYLGEVGISFILYIIIVVIIFLIAQRIKYGKVSLRIEIPGYNSLRVNFKGKTMKVSKLLFGQGIASSFKKIKIKRTNSKTLNVKILHSQKQDKETVYSLSKITVLGLNNQQITIYREV